MNSLPQSELITIVRSYIKNWKLFLASFIVCLGLAGAYILIANPEFKIAANILIKEDSKGGGMSGIAASMMKGMAFGDMLSVGGGVVDDEVEVISSYTTLYKSVKELGLNVSYTEGLLKKKNYYMDAPIVVAPVIPAMADTFRYHVKMKVDIDKNQKVKVKAYYKREKLGEVTSSFPVTVPTKFGDFTVDKTRFFKEEEPLKMTAVYSGYSGVTQALTKKVDISIASKKANVINLLYEDEIPARGKDLLNTIIRTYNEYGIAEKNITAERTAKFLQQRIDIMDADLKSVERAVESYKEANNLTDIESEAKIILDKSSDFKEKLINAETQFTVISMIEDFLKAPENRYAVVPMSLGIEEKSAVESLLSYNELLLERLKLLRSTNPGNPIIESMNEQVDATRLSVLVTIQSIKRGIEYARNDLRMQEETFMNRIKGMPKQEREYIEIKRQQEIKQALYLYLLQQQEENALKLAMANPKAQIIDDAFYYTIPVKPMKKLIALAAFIMACLLPMAYLHLRKMFVSKFSGSADLPGDNKVYISDELHHSDRNILFAEPMQGTVEEDFRNVRSSVLRMFDNDLTGKSVTVASIKKGEGRSFVALNMALSVARLGKKVLLVDADMRSGHSLSDNPSVCRNNGTGVAQVVAGEADASSAVSRSLVDDNLFIMPSGGRNENASEILLNGRFVAMLDEFKKKYDFVVIDSASLFEYSDTVSLMALTDGTLFVTRADYSDKHVFAYIESLIETGRVSRYICIVNDVKEEKGK